MKIAFVAGVVMGMSGVSGPRDVADFFLGSDGGGSIRHSAVEGRVEVPQRRPRGRRGHG